MQFEYKNSGVCSRGVRFEVENNIVNNVEFIGGCHGNTQGVAALANGMDIDEVIRRIKGICCGGKGTSCPDQFACALEAAKAELAK